MFERTSAFIAMVLLWDKMTLFYLGQAFLIQRIIRSRMHEDNLIIWFLCAIFYFKATWIVTKLVTIRLHFLAYAHKGAHVLVVYQCSTIIEYFSGVIES